MTVSSSQSQYDEATITPNVEHEATAPNPSAKPPKKRKSWWMRGLRLFICLLLVLLLLLMGGLIWLLATEQGLRFGLAKLPPLAGVSIKSQSLQGSVWHGFQGDGWQIETEAADIDMSRLVFDWQPSALWQQKMLHIQNLTVGNIHIVNKPTPPKEDDPPIEFPDSINLPLAVQVDRLAVGKISINQADNVVLKGGEIAYHYDHQQHQLSIKHLQTPWLNNQGKLTVQTTSPFAIQGQITGNGVLGDVAAEGVIQLSGSLKTLALNTHLQSGKVKLEVSTQISPFEHSLNKMIGNLHLKGDSINPRDFLPTAPQANLEFDAYIVPTGQNEQLALEGSIDLANHAAKAADKEGIPVRSIIGDFVINQVGVVQLSPTHIRLLDKGIITLTGNTDTSQQQLQLDAKITQFTLSDVVQQSFADVLNGEIQLRGSYREPQALWTLNSHTIASQGEVQLATDTQHGQQTVVLKKAAFQPKNGGEMNVVGKLELFDKQQLQLNINSKNFNPNKVYADFPVGNVNGEIKLDGVLADAIFNGKMAFAPSTLSGVALRGTADVQYQQQHLSRAVSDIALGRNHLRTNGSFGKAGDKLNIDIDAPELDKIGFGLSGALLAKGYIAGEPQKIEANLNGNIRHLRIQNALNIQQLDFAVQGSPDYSRPLKVQLKGSQLVVAGESPTRIDNVQLNINGTGLRHTIQSSGSMALDGKPYKLNVAAHGGLNPQNQWQGTVNVLDISGAFNLKLQNSMNLQAGAERVAMSAARWSAMGGNLNLNSFVWDKTHGLTTKGSANNLHISQLHNFFTPPVEHNIVLNSDWDLAYSQNARGYLNISRQSGDVILPMRKQNLGLSKLELNTRFQNGRIDNTLKGMTRYGELVGNIAISQQFGNDIQRAPINGHIRLNIPDLTSIRNLMPVGQTVKGSLTAQANIGGTVGTPLLNGTLNGDQLYYINRDIGLILDNGSLRSRLAGQKWYIDSLRFQRGGTITINGDISLDKGSPDVNVRAVFDKYQALDKPSRHLTLSGETQLHYVDNAGVTLTGNLKLDEGRFGFQKSSMPTLDDDVVIVGAAHKEQAPPTKINLNLILDLNDRFRFSGEGLDVTLGGQLTLRAKSSQDVQGVGTVNIVKGKYKAYGQDLNITKGAISFVGPLDNPNLNIRATRNLSPVGAGVEVLGNLNTPRITLVANEPMSEKDKLSWLILNRASSGSDGDEATLAAAAGAFLAGNINDKIGLVDDFGMTSKRSRNAQTGELNPAEQVLTVGKQLSSELYLGYEYGINSADQSVKLIYQLTRSIQAIARVGSRSWGGEMKYVIRFD